MRIKDPAIDTDGIYTGWKQVQVGDRADEAAGPFAFGHGVVTLPDPFGTLDMKRRLVLKADWGYVEKTESASGAALFLHDYKHATLYELKWDEKDGVWHVRATHRLVYLLLQGVYQVYVSYRCIFG